MPSSPLEEKGSYFADIQTLITNKSRVSGKPPLDRSPECMIMPSNSLEEKGSYLDDIQALLTKRSKVFENPPPSRPLEHGTEHIIELEEGTKPVMTTPYWYPKKHKDEIEKAIKELLDMGYIRPSC